MVIERDFWRQDMIIIKLVKIKKKKIQKKKYLGFFVYQCTWKGSQKLLV